MLGLSAAEKTSLQSLLTAAEDYDDVNAQYLLGKLYLSGDKVGPNKALALKWFTRSGKQGHAQAQFETGKMYLIGNGVSRNLNQAKLWLHKAANRDLKEAVIFLADLYYRGTHFPRDYLEALPLYEKAAKLGSTKAMNTLSLMYVRGQGTLKNSKRSIEWLQLAADNSDRFATYKLANAYNVGASVEQDRARAVELFKKSASLGHHEAKYKLGLMYLNGNGVNKDIKQAKKWLIGAQKGGVRAASVTLKRLNKSQQHALAKSHKPEGTAKPSTLNKLKTSQNIKTTDSKSAKSVDNKPANNSEQIIYKAKKKSRHTGKLLALENKARTGDLDAQFRMAMSLLYKRKKSQQDIIDGVIWLKRAANKHHLEAQYMLGNEYRIGDYLPKNFNKARQWFKLAAVKDHPQANYQLGVIYSKGLGIKKDEVKAKEYFNKAAKLGIGDAKSQIQKMSSKKNIQVAAVGRNSLDVARSHPIEKIFSSAEKGDPKAQLKLAIYFRDGIEVDKNTIKSIKWFNKSAIQGNAEAQYQLALIYSSEEFKDNAKAVSWYRKAARQGHLKARRKLGGCVIC